MSWKITYTISNEEKAALDAVAATQGITPEVLLSGAVKSATAQIRRKQMMAVVEASVALMSSPSVTIEEE